MSNQKKRDQIVDAVNRLTAARAAVASVEGELDALLMPGGPAPAEEPAKRGKAKNRVAAGKKAAATRAARKAEMELAQKPASEMTNYEKLERAVKKAPAGKDWTVKELQKASKVKGSSVFEVVKRAVRERLLVKTGYGQYRTGPQGEAAALN